MARATDIASIMTTSVDPEVQTRSQNTGNRMHAAQSADIINTQLAETLSVQKQSSDLARQAAQLQLDVVVKGNEMTQQLEKEVKGTTDMINMLEQQQMDALRSRAHGFANGLPASVARRRPRTIVVWL